MSAFAIPITVLVMTCNICVSLVKSPFSNYESLFFSEAALASDRARSVTNIPLTGEEKLNAGDVVGIDAEFVSLNQVCVRIISSMF